VLDDAGARTGGIASRFTFIDLFAGIGGFHLALSDLGGECVFASEIDTDAAAVYAENFDLKPAGDIRAVHVDQIPQHDVLCAGFPCQPFSKSGAQMGLDDETRGTLFFEIARIAEARRPRFLMLENVRNIAKHDNGRTWRVIIGRLRELGYRVSTDPLIFSPHLLPPDQGGAPQFRERVFVLAEHRDYGGDKRPDRPLIENKPIGSWDPQDWDLKRWLRSHSADEEDLTPYLLRNEEIRWIEAWGDLARRVVDRLPGFPLWEQEFVDRPTLSGLPGWKQDFHRKNSDFYLRYRRQIDSWRKAWRVDEFPASRRKFEWQAQESTRDTADDIFELLIQLRPSGIRVKRPTYVPALVAITQTSVLGWERRRLTPREAASLQGIPTSFRLHEHDATAYRQLGNGVHTGVVRFLASAMFAESGFGVSQARGSKRRVPRARIAAAAL
jgi:DNA (cytosine-5)-methyltransferase 1